MAVEIIRRYQRGDREQLLVDVGGSQFFVWIVPIADQNGQVSGYRAWTGRHYPTHATAEDALQSALGELQQLHASPE